MQMMVEVIGFGIGIPKTNIQVSTVNIAKFYVRHGLNDRNPARFNVQDLIAIGSKSGTFFINRDSYKVV